MKKNYDPRMHSAEHILNQTMVRLYDCGRCFTAHIGKKKSKCDYHFDHALTEEEIAKIQLRVNNVIDSDLPVTESFVSRDEAERLYGVSAQKLRDTLNGYTPFLNNLTHEREKNIAYLKSALALLVKDNNIIYHGVASPLLPKNITTTTNPPNTIGRTFEKFWGRSIGRMTGGVVGDTSGTVVGFWFPDISMVCIL